MRKARVSARKARGSDSGTAAEGAALHDLFAREWAWRVVALFAREWAWRVVVDPLSAAVSGWRDKLSALPDGAPAARAERTTTTQAFLSQLQSINRDSLSRRDQVSADLMHQQLAERIRIHELGAWEMPVHTQGGFHQTLTFLPSVLPLRTTADVQRYLSVLRDVPRSVDPHIANTRRGLERGMT